ncbi:MAG: nucleotidyltransferase family protein [Deltaproteobacteria bacterium]|nr:nucleotidyltransferase family protein [Deltaproteobacteria bacterium]MBW2308622.1 nucleotidyltransferase family protein [Deltaproteobacteria bacterium]
MKSIVLAAGYGTRLYPLTKDRPKPLLPIAGKPIIEHIIAKLDPITYIQEIFVVTNDRFYPHFRKWEDGFQSRFTIRVINDGTRSNEDRLGAIGDIHFAVQFAGLDDDLLVIGGDNLFDFNLTGAAEEFLRRRRSVVGLFDMKDPGKVARLYGVVSVDENGRVTRLDEKPEHPRSALISTAIYFLCSEDVQELKRCIESGYNPDNAGDFIRYLSEKREVFAHIFDGVWYDIGSQEQYTAADEHYTTKENHM